MGNRVVVGFQNRKDEPIIYLYQHWGDETESALADAIYMAVARWSDPDYATRIVISRLVANDWKQELGYGISVNRFAYPDYETIKIVRWEEKVVTTNSSDDPETEISRQDLESFVIRNLPKTRLVGSGFDKKG